MPPLVIHALVPLSTHSSVAVVVDGPRAQAGDVRPGVGLAHAERPELHLVGRAVALRHPLHDLLGRAVAGDPRGGQPRAHDRHADAGVAPEQLLDGDRQREARRVGDGVHQEVDAVEPDLGGLLDDRPRELLPLVPLVGGRADDVSRRSRGSTSGSAAGPRPGSARRCVMTLSYQSVTRMSTRVTLRFSDESPCPAGVVSTSQPSACSAAADGVGPGVVLRGTGRVEGGRLRPHLVGHDRRPR